MWIIPTHRMSDTPSPTRKQSGRWGVITATVTPLASILGSGLLIIVPVLEMTLGAFAIVGAVAICAVAWLTGTAIRHNVVVVEPRASTGTLDTHTARLGQLADAVIVIACGAVALIVAIGALRGFNGLDRLDRVSLSVVLLLTVLLGIVLLAHDLTTIASGGVRLPPCHPSRRSTHCWCSGGS